MKATSTTSHPVDLGPPRIRAVVFDFDGTLAELTLDFAAMRADVIDLTVGYGLSIEESDGRPVLELIDDAHARLLAYAPAAAAAYRSDAIAQISSREIAAARDGRLFDGVRSFLTALRSRGLRIAIVTRNCEVALRIVFPDVDDYVDAVVSRERTPHVKPHPDHLACALSMLAVEPSRALMIGDHPIDMRAGSAARIRSIGVLGGAGTLDALMDAGAHTVLSSVHRLLDLLS